MVKYPPTETIVSYSGMILGAIAFTSTQIVARETLDKFMKGCTTTEEFLDSGLHEYEAILGGPFVCIVTNFLLELTKNPEGVFIWGLIAGIRLPTAVVIFSEAYRRAAKGLVRYPTVTCLLSQFFGISVVFSSVWIPAYMWGGCYDGQVGVKTMYWSLALSLTFAILSILLFTLQTSSLAWTVTAGLLGGPAMGLLPSLLFTVPGPRDNTYASKSRGAHALATAYDVVGLVAFLGYVLNMYLIVQAYGVDGPRIWDKLWSSEAVAFVAIEALILHLAVTLMIYFRGWDFAVTAIVFVPLMGPGAALAQALARQERKLAKFFDWKKEKSQ